MCQFPQVKWDRNSSLLLFCTILKNQSLKLTCLVCASPVQSKGYLLYILRALWLVWMQSHRLGEACRHVKILYTHLYSEVNYFFACWGYFFQCFFLLQEINANADFPSGGYKGRSFCSNHLKKVRFGLNLKGKASLQQHSQEQQDNLVQICALSYLKLWKN